MVCFSNKDGYVMRKCTCIEAKAGLESLAIDNWLRLISDSMLFKSYTTKNLNRKLF